MIDTDRGYIPKFITQVFLEVLISEYILITGENLRISQKTKKKSLQCLHFMNQS